MSHCSASLGGDRDKHSDLEVVALDREPGSPSHYFLGREVTGLPFLFLSCLRLESSLSGLNHF